MTKEKEIHYVTKCPICGEPIYPYPAEYDGHCQIIHKTAKEQIKDLEERVSDLEKRNR
ncbi:MAG: hypothetical protein IMF19_14225 [Proteobacteria bacterium]|nr:hypothetical protein [Pseudomonadota bacterium]